MMFLLGIEILGVFGSYKESGVLILMYAIKRGLFTIFSLIKAIHHRNAFIWSIFSAGLFTSILAIVLLTVYLAQGREIGGGYLNFDYRGN